MPSRKKIVERELGVKIPAQYEVFLNKYGIYEAFGTEVYGINDTLLHYDGMPCVIGATKLRRERENLPHRFLVIHHTDLEDETICLDTEDGKVYSMSRDFGNHKIADTFDEWFQRDIIEFDKEMEERRKREGPSQSEILDFPLPHEERYKLFDEDQE